MTRKILTFIISATSFTLLLLTLVLVFMGIVAARENRIVSVFGYSFAAVATDSMAPTIEPKEIVVAKKTKFDAVRQGDIIVFYSAPHGAYFVHRVVEVRPDGELVTKGDNPEAPIDADPVTAANYHGKVIAHGDFLGLGKLMLERRSAVYAVIVVALLLIIVIETASIVTKVIRKQKREFMKKIENK